MIVYLWKSLWKKTQSSLRYVKIALCVIVVYLLILAIFSRVFQSNKKNIYANTNTKVAQQGADEIRSFITNKEISKTQTGKLAISLVKGLSCSLVGDYCFDNLDKKNPSNLSTFIASAFVYPFANPPASGIGATVQTLAQAGFIPKSYAAEGVGFASIRPLMGVWKAMRDVAYLLLVLVIVTIGFMIMLRTKINPQTVVKAENALPKIVITLIYITFSFAIAGFLIDLMYIVIVLLIAILGPQFSAVAPSTKFFLLGGPRTAPELMKVFLQASPWDIIGLLVNFDAWNIFWKLPSALLGILGDGMGIILRIIIQGIFVYLISPIIGAQLEPLKLPDAEAGAAFIASINFTGVIKAVISFLINNLKLGLAVIASSILVPILIGVIIFLTILLLFFRIFFMLFSNYIKLLVLIIISPLYLLLEAIPGQSTFVSWVKNLIELLVPFPVIIGSFLIGSIIMGTSTQGTLFTPPFIFGLHPEHLSVIVGMWILFMIPDFIGIAQKAINPKPLPLDAGLGTFFGGAKTGVETGLGEMSKYALLAQSFTPLGKVFNLIPGFDKTKLKKGG